MKLSQLLKPRKPKKQKPDPLFFGWYGLGYAISPPAEATGSDGGVSEEVKTTEQEADKRNNFGFRPEMRQFWFRIEDRPLFFDRQHEWQVEQGSVRSTYPNHGFISDIFEKHIMVRGNRLNNHSTQVTLLRYGELHGNGKNGDAMVFMFDPKKSVPSTKKMKEFGLKPVFMEQIDAD